MTVERRIVTVPTNILSALPCGECVKEKHTFHSCSDCTMYKWGVHIVHRLGEWEERLALL